MTIIALIVALVGGIILGLRWGIRLSEAATWSYRNAAMLSAKKTTELGDENTALRERLETYRRNEERNLSV